MSYSPRGDAFADRTLIRRQIKPVWACGPCYYEADRLTDHSDPDEPCAEEAG